MPGHGQNYKAWPSDACWELCFLKLVSQTQVVTRGGDIFWVRENYRLLQTIEHLHCFFQTDLWPLSCHRLHYCCSVSSARTDDAGVQMHIGYNNQIDPKTHARWRNSHFFSLRVCDCSYRSTDEIFDVTAHADLSSYQQLSVAWDLFDFSLRLRCLSFITCLQGCFHFRPSSAVHGLFLSQALRTCSLSCFLITLAFVVGKEKNQIQLALYHIFWLPKWHLMTMTFHRHGEASFISTSKSGNHTAAEAVDCIVVWNCK